MGGIAMRPDGHGLLWTDRGLWRTADGRRTWASPAFVDPDGARFPISAALLDDRSWLVLVRDSRADAVTLERTSDGGMTWNAVAAWPLPAATAAASSAPGSLAPTLTANQPRVAVTPSSGLRDGQAVHVRVSGFGVGGKVWISECASARDASDLGCGAQLAAQPFLVTDKSRAGQMIFMVSPQAPTRPLNATPTVTCTDACVIVATLGDGFPYAIAPISFAAPSPSLPAAVAPCTSDQLATSVVDTGTAAGTVEGWLRFLNTTELRSGTF